MQRLLTSMFALGLSLGVAGCDDAKEEPAKTAKKDDKSADAKTDDKSADAKTDADPGGDAKPDPDPAGDAEPDPDPADDDADPAADADPAEDAAPDEALEGYDPRVAKAAQVATKISEEPDSADELLAAANLDRDKLDELMYEIANDPDLTAQYRMARGI